jgi:hypothetical protein
MAAGEAYYPSITAGDAASVQANGTVVQAIVQPNTFVQVFELTDTAYVTPLTIKTPSGLTDTKVPVGALPIFPDVYVVSPNFAHNWKSGTLVFRRDSADAKDKVVAESLAAAQIAASNAGTAAVADVAARIAAGQFKGEDGADGRDGANVATTRTAVAAELEDPASPSRTVLSSTIAETPVPTEPLNLKKQFKAIGNGVANDTSAVKAWITAVAASGRAGYAPAGTYMLDCDQVSQLLSGAVLYGDSDRKTVFKARSAGTRLLDFRQSGTVRLRDFAVDGNNLAQTNLDLGNSGVGASTGNMLDNVRTLNQLDRGFDLSNNGDTVAKVNGGPWPDSATGVYWPNSGGNNLLVDPKLFPTAANPGPARAAVEASFQNMDIRGGALMGIRVLDSSSSHTLRAAGVQFYAIKDGGNVIGPKAGAGIYSFVADGATKFATITSTQSYFDGWFQFLLSAKGCTFNSGVLAGTPNAFGPDFSGSNGTQKLLLDVKGSVLRAEAGATTATWNDTISTNVEVDYENFAGPVHRNHRSRVRAGVGVAGTGLQVGNGVLLRAVLSSPLSPTAWASDQIIAAGTYISTVTPMAGIAQANGLIVECAVFLPSGVHAVAKVSGSNAVRLEVYNQSGASYTLPAGTAFRVYALQI